MSDDLGVEAHAKDFLPSLRDGGNVGDCLVRDAKCFREFNWRQTGQPWTGQDTRRNLHLVAAGSSIDWRQLG